MTNRANLLQDIENARAELDRLRASRLNLEPGDAEGAINLRRLIAATELDLAALREDLAAVTDMEARQRAKPAREKGRTLIREGLAKADDTHRLWLKLDGLLAEAIAVAQDIATSGKGAVSVLREAIAIGLPSGQFGVYQPTNEHMTTHATGSSSMFAQALAVRIRDLLNAVPGGYRVTSDHFPINPMAAWNGASVQRAIEHARADLQQRVGRLCDEPEEELQPQEER